MRGRPSFACRSVIGHYSAVTAGEENEGAFWTRASAASRFSRAMGGDEESAWERFRNDTAASGRVWVRQPWLPILTVVVWLPLSGAWAPEFRFGPLLPVFAFALGFLGMQREWYAMAFSGARPSARRIWSRSWRYFVRFLPVAVVALVAFPLLIGGVVVPIVLRLGSASDFHTELLRIEITVAAWSFLLDFLLTFVMPALVFTTANPFKAFAIGMRYLRHAWSAVKWHALVPPTAVIVVGQIISGHQTAAMYGVTLTLLGAMLNLLFKGAQVAAYLVHADELGVTIDDRALNGAP